MIAGGNRDGHTAAHRFALTGFSRWGLWRLPAKWLIGYILMVDLAAVAGTGVAFSRIPLDGNNLFPFLVLMVCSVFYTEASRPIEEVREGHRGSPHIDLNSVWMFAAVLLLHPGLAAVVIATSYFYRWLRVSQHIVYRQTFSAAAAVLAAYAAAAFLAVVSDRPFAEMDRDAAGFVQIVAASVVFLLVNSILVTIAVYGSMPGARLRDALGAPADYALEAATIALGLLLAWALVDWPIALLLIIGITLVLHRCVLIRQLREQARTDGKTGLLNASAWSDAADAELARGDRLNRTSGLLMLDLDHFKQINDRHGHLVGDGLLRAVAETLDAEVRACDLTGRFGGEEFVVMLPDTSRHDAFAIAERIRRSVSGTTIRAASAEVGATVSIGLAVHPGDGGTLSALLKSADSALYEAKSGGRDRTVGYERPVPVTVSAVDDEVSAR